MNNWSQLLVTILKVTFPHHGHIIWSCASNQLNLSICHHDSKFPALPTVPYLMLSAKPLKGIFTNYLWFTILLSSQLLQKSSLQSLSYKDIFQLFKRKTFKTISTLLLTLSHYFAFSPASLSFPCLIPPQPFPSEWGYSLGIADRQGKDSSP